MPRCFVEPDQLELTRTCLGFKTPPRLREILCCSLLRTFARQVDNGIGLAALEVQAAAIQVAHFVDDGEVAPRRVLRMLWQAMSSTKETFGTHDKGRGGAHGLWEMLKEAPMLCGVDGVEEADGSQQEDNICHGVAQPGSACEEGGLVDVLHGQPSGGLRR